MAKLSPRDARKGAGKKVGQSGRRGAESVRTRTGSDRLVPVRDSDSLEFDKWLLPPVPPSRSERIVQRISMIAGPVLLVAACFAILYFFFTYR